MDVGPKEDKVVRLLNMVHCLHVGLLELWGSQTLDIWSIKLGATPIASRISSIGRPINKTSVGPLCLGLTPSKEILEKNLGCQTSLMRCYQTVCCIGSLIDISYIVRSL